MARRTRGELSPRTARKSPSQLLRNDCTSSARHRACTALGLWKRQFCKTDKPIKNCAGASVSPDQPTRSCPLSESRFPWRWSLANLLTLECSVADIGTAAIWWPPGGVTNLWHEHCYVKINWDFSAQFETSRCRGDMAFRARQRFFIVPPTPTGGPRRN